MLEVIPPVPDRTDEFFWQGVQDHRLLVQRCASCGRLRVPPVPMCGHCHALEWEAIEVSGRGTIYSWVLSRHPGGSDTEPRIVVLVALDEGPRFVSNLVDVHVEAVRNGERVYLVFREIGGVLLPVFVLGEGVEAGGDLT